MTKRVVLSKGRSRPVRAGHPNVYPGAVAAVEGGPATGDEVDVVDFGERFVGRGVFHATAAVRVRVHRRDRGPLDGGWVSSRIADAVRLRRDVLRLDRDTDAYRLVHGDGDRFPGLVVDRYGDFAVVSVTALGAADRRADVAAAVMEHAGVRGVWERPATSFARAEGFHAGGGRLAGEMPPEVVEVREGGVVYRVDVRGGAKTGHFLDQRGNRRIFADLVAGRAVLDTFSGTGGFGLSALVVGDAASVLALDSSSGALARLAENARANGVEDRVETQEGDAFDGLRALVSAKRRFGAVSLDPPRFASARRQIRGALRGYRELNLQALALLEPGGILATSSCSGVVDDGTFLTMLRDAAADAGRRLQVLRVSGQGPDHPWLTAAPEGRYLKFVLARVV